MPETSGNRQEVDGSNADELVNRLCRMFGHSLVGLEDLGRYHGLDLGCVLPRGTSTPNDYIRSFVQQAARDGVFENEDFWAELKKNKPNHSDREIENLRSIATIFSTRVKIENVANVNEEEENLPQKMLVNKLFEMFGHSLVILEGLGRNNGLDLRYVLSWGTSTPKVYIRSFVQQAAKDGVFEEDEFWADLIEARPNHSNKSIEYLKAMAKSYSETFSQGKKNIPA